MFLINAIIVYALSLLKPEHKDLICETLVTNMISSASMLLVFKYMPGTETLEEVNAVFTQSSSLARLRIQCMAKSYEFILLLTTKETRKFGSQS